MPKFVVSVAKFDDSIDLSNIPDIALIGPSNSGKSSIINSLARSRIALVSNKPGKTRTLNYYDFEKYYLVDTPGYGYSQGSKVDKEKLLSILDAYFSGPRPIIGVFQVISSHGLSKKDVEVFEFLTSKFHNYTLLVNKSDKLTQSSKSSLLASIKDLTNLSSESVVLISAKEGINLQMVSRRLREYLN